MNGVSDDPSFLQVQNLPTIINIQLPNIDNHKCISWFYIIEVRWQVVYSILVGVCEIVEQDSYFPH
jgi:hypothetical protein